MSNPTISQAQREAPSLMGPLVLIAIGVYFLLYNMGILPSFNWWMIVRFWPLILIFIGVNILVRQLPQPFGSLLSLVVGIVAIATFGYLVFFGTAAAPSWQLPFWGEADFKTERITFAPTDINEATVKISTDVPGIHLYGTNAGTMDIIFPEQGEQEMMVNISAGNMTLRLPENRDVQLTVDKAVGNLTVDNGRLARISKNDGHEVWQTPNFDNAIDPIRLRLDIAAGNVRIYTIQ